MLGFDWMDACLNAFTTLLKPLVLITQFAFPCSHYTSLAKELYFLQNAEGSGLAPFDCWVCLRGIKTLALRVEKQQVPVPTCILFLCPLSKYLSLSVSNPCWFLNPIGSFCFMLMLFLDSLLVFWLVLICGMLWLKLSFSLRPNV